MFCHYCGALANTKDHIIPISYIRNSRPKWCINIGTTVDCCKECNCLLGAKALFSVPERAHELSERLERRYRKELNAPIWSDEDLSELGPSLQDQVKAKQHSRLEILERIRNASAVACGLLEKAIPLYSLSEVIQC